MPQIFSTHPLHPDVTARLTAVSDYRVASAPTAAAIMAEGLDADIVIVRTNIPPAYFAQAKRLRAAVRHGAGLDMIPMQAATAAGVVVSNVPGANAQTVAEYAIFAAIALLRQFRPMDTSLRSQGWTAGRAVSDRSRDLSGQTLGIFGYGNIGRAVHRMAQGFGVKITSHTRSPQNLPPDVQPLSLDALVATSDVLVLCAPLTDETRGALSASRIASLKPGAVVINVSRGPIIDTAALIPALQSGRIAAALDVFDTQPLPAESPLWHLPNVLLTPHVAGITQDSMLRMGQVATDEVLRILNGDLPRNFCNPEVEASYRRRFRGRSATVPQRAP